MSAATAWFTRALRARARSGGWAAATGLFVMVLGLAPLSLGRDPALLAATGPALLWIGAALALLLGLDGLFEDDLRSGALGLVRLSPLPLSMAVLLTALAAWLTTCLPLIVIGPVLLLAFGGGDAASTALGLLLGTPALALLSTAMSALIAGSARGAALLVILALPLFAPALVFGPSTAAADGIVPPLMLAAFSLQALAFCPFVAAAALRSHMS